MKHKNEKRYPVAEAIERRLLMSTYTVNTLSDAVNPGAGLLTLRQAVADDNAYPVAGVTIGFDPAVFPPGELHTIMLTQGPIEFTDASVAINGPGAAVLAISGGGRSRVFEVDYQARLSLSGISVINGNGTSGNDDGAFGGAIVNAGQLTIAHSNISGNAVSAAGVDYKNDPITGTGGGIYSTGSLTITNSMLTANSVTCVATAGETDNYASPPSGGAFGGAIYTTGPLILAGCTVSGNTASGLNGNLAVLYGGGEAEGGGIYATGTVAISQTTITGNVAAGGHAQFSYSAGPSGNASGGGIYTAGAITISASTITDNSALGGDCGFDSGESGGASGGGITSGSSLTIIGSTINNNAATALGNYFGTISRGGGICGLGEVSILQSSVNDNTLTGSSGYADQTMAAGAGVYAGGTLALVQSSESGNIESCQYSFDWYGGVSIGGGIDAAAGGSISQSTISGDSALGGRGYSSDTGNDQYSPKPGGDGSGGGIYTSGAMTITQSTIAGDIARGGDGGGGSDNGGTSGDGQQAGSGSGGGVCSIADLDVVDSTISGNTATGGAGGDGGYDGGNGGNAGGGGIFPAAALSVADSTICGNTVTAGAGGGDLQSVNAYFHPGTPGTATGGGVDGFGIISLFTNSIISGNKAASGFNDLAGGISLTSSNNLVGIGGGLTNGVNGDKIGVTNPQLSPLGYYGGPTQTMLPLPGSPVIDAGNNSLIPAGITTDQRGDPRISGKAVDIGSVEFGNVAITGTVFNDQSASGKSQTGDAGIAGFTIFLDLNHDGALDAGDYPATTNAAGQYTFNGLSAGTYTVDIEAMKHYRGTTATSQTITAKSGQTLTAAAFGETQDALISGAVINATTKALLSGWRVYIDFNDDGKWESTEPTVVTSSNGQWSFNIATPGTYEIRIVPMSKYTTTAPTGGVFTFTVGKASARIGNVFSEQAID